jgi:hypothetical protein
MAAGPRYIASARTAQKTPLPTTLLLLRVTQPLPNNGCFSSSTVFDLSKYATMSSKKVVEKIVTCNLCPMQFFRLTVFEITKQMWP